MTITWLGGLLRRRTGRLLATAVSISLVIRVAGPRMFHLETAPLGTRPGGSACDAQAQ